MKALLFIRRHRTVVWLATALLVILGVAAAKSMPSGIYPEVEFPRIVIVARTGGAPPEVFLTTVTRPLEQMLTTVMGLQRVRSKTIRGATEISLQFTPGTDMWRALQLVESRVAEVRASLPPDAEVVVERVTTGSFPVLTFNLSGAVDPRELRESAEFVVRPALASVPGVGRIEVVGGDVREIEVILDPEKTSALHLDPSKVADRLRTGMSLRAVGRVDRDRQLVTVIADAQPKTLAEIADAPIMTTPTGGVIPLSAIAEVVESTEDRTVRVGGPKGETVVLSLARLPGASTPDVVNRAIDMAAQLKKTLPKGMTLEPVYDQASLVEESMASVRDAIILGIVLSAAVIALFLKDLRAGALAAASIPITLAVTFGAMWVAHQTLNLMSLGGMAVGIGLIVDDAIVMIEAITRHRDRGDAVESAALTGTTELAPAVIGTTMTTVVVFLPLAFLDGIVGDFFRALAFTLTAAVFLSLIVALVLVPLASAFALRSGKTRAPRSMPRSVQTLRASLLHRPWIAALIVAAVIALGFVLAPRVQRGFLPTMDEGAFVLDYFLPAGTSLSTTEAFARDLEHELSATPEVATFSRRLGSELGPAAATQLNRGDIMVRLVAPGSRSRSSDEVIADLRGRIESKLPEVRVEFMQVLQDVLNDLAGSPRPIEVKILGPDYAELHRMGDALASKLKSIAGLVDLYDGHERDVPELRYASKRDAIARFGATPDDVGSQLETALRGAKVGTIRRLDRLIGVRTRYPNPVRFDPERVLDLPFTAGERTTSFRAVSDPGYTTSASLLLHEALQPLVTITADHEGRDLGALSRDIEKVIADTPVPSGYRVVMGGQIEGERATLRQLTLVGSIAVLLVLTVLASQFHRFRLALIVLSSVPVAIVGALFGLVVTATPLNASSLMGCVLLVGLVVKNGVLLLEEAERLVDQGASAMTAVTEASDRRLRPVLMTTLATLAGLLPLALGIGAGAELQRPLAIAVIGGLVTSTVATLGLLPAFAAFILTPRHPKAVAT